MPRLSFGQALPVGLSSLGEFVDIHLLDWLKAETVKNRLPQELFPGTRIVMISEVFLNSPLPNDQVYYYEVELTSSLLEGNRVQEFLAAEHWPAEKTGKKPERIDLRPLIQELSLRLKEDGTITARWSLTAGHEHEIRPEMVLRSILNLPTEMISGLPVQKSLADSSDIGKEKNS
jgi:radical SAM-linked protein